MRKLRFLSLVMAIACMAFTGLTEVANAAAGDSFYADVRLRNRNSLSGSIISIPNGFQESAQDWLMPCTSNLTTSRISSNATTSRWRIVFRNVQNGQIIAEYRDQYGTPWQNLYDVRHGTSGYAYEIDRYFNKVSVLDINGQPMAIDGLYFQPTGTPLNTKYMAFGGAGGYHVPCFLRGNYTITLSYGGAKIPVNASGMAGIMDDFVIPTNFSRTRSLEAPSASAPKAAGSSKKMRSANASFNELQENAVESSNIDEQSAKIEEKKTNEKSTEKSKSIKKNSNKRERRPSKK